MHTLWLGTNVSWRETHCFTFQDCQSSGLLFALLFSFLRTENAVQCKEEAADRPHSALTLEHAIPEAQTAFHRGNIPAALSLLLSPLNTFHGIWLFHGI